MLDNDTLLALETAVPGAARDSSQARLSLLAFVANEQTETALRDGLLNAVEGTEFRRGTILHAVKHLAKEPTPRALVVDISGVDCPLDHLENLARVCTPDVKVLVIGEDASVGFYRDLVRNMGVAEYLHKPLTRDNVARLFVPPIAGLTVDTSASRTGCVIAVCGTRGGVGTSTVAVSLAQQLSSTTQGHIALLDLHLRQGTTALMLGVTPVGGLRTALESPDRADALFLDRVCVEINPRLRLIAAQESLEETPAPTANGMHRVLDLLRRRFNYVVIDLPMPANPAEMQALRDARHLLAVMTPDLVSIRDVNRLRQMATGLGINRTVVVLNRLGMLGGLTLPLIEKGLDGKPIIQIPDLGKQLGRAANLGKSALTESAVFGKAMVLLTREMSGTPGRRISRPPGGSFLSRMLAR